MAVDPNDMNEIRVDVLGTTVDKAATWTSSGPMGNRNTLNTAERIINRAINSLDTQTINALNGTNGFDGRFSVVIGDEAGADQTAFAAIGKNLIQAIADIISGGAAGGVLSITVGTTSTGAPGSNATVTMTGTASDPELNFTIPRGDDGVPGTNGTNGTDGITPTVGATAATGLAGSSASVATTGTLTNPMFNFTIPRGDQGVKGDKGDDGVDGQDGTGVTILGNYADEIALRTAHPTGNPGDAYLVGSDLWVWSPGPPPDWVNVGNIRGPKGDDGVDGVDGVTPAVTATAATGLAGTFASVTQTGTTAAPVFNFTIPRGDTGTNGTNGVDGDDATVAIGTTTTGTAGSSAVVTNTGTASAAVFNFTIPRGDPGTDGTNGTNGITPSVSATAATGAAGSTASVTTTGTAAAPVFNFTIPRGDAGTNGTNGTNGTDGTNGTNGTDGVTPTFSIGTVTTGATPAVTITGAAPAYVLNFVLPEAQGPPPVLTAPAITSPLVPVSQEEGTVFSYIVTATGNPPPSLGVTGLPAGLTFTSPTISGTLPAHPSGPHTINISATNSQGTDNKSFTLTVLQAAPPTGWQVTHNFPVPPVTFNDVTGRVALNATNWAGWQAAYNADMTDALYDAPTPADLPVNLYATFAGQSEVLVDFDNWGGTAAPNKITEWGYHSSSHSIYIIGNNSTGSPIQLRLVKV